MVCNVCNKGTLIIKEFKNGYTYKCNECSLLGFIPHNHIQVTEYQKELIKQNENQV